MTAASEAPGATSLAMLVRACATVAATSKRTAKAVALAELLGHLPPSEVAIAVDYLQGQTPQQRLGVGWAGTWRVEAPPAVVPQLSIADVDACFTALAAAAGTGSQAQRQRLLHDLFSCATLDEQDFLRRLIIGELRHGALAGVVADGVALAAGVPSAAVRRAAMLSGDLGVAARVALGEGELGLDAIGLSVLRPLQPMLAATANSVADALTELGTASVEWKLDGVRIQVHRDGATVRVFTRNLNDVTHRLGNLVEQVRQLPVNACILDGELIGLREDDAPQLFQDTAASFAAEVPQLHTLQPFFFDILHADGRDLIDEPLSERQTVLQHVTGELRIPTLVTNDPAVAARFADQALAAGHEGVVLKAIDSRYDAGRRGKAWRKVKPVRTLDLLVVGAEWGHGRRQGWLSNLHLGARDPLGGPPIMVGKTFKGLTDALLTWQTAELQQRVVADRGHTVDVRAELVVEIALDGVQRSRRYPGGVALRFARVKRYRPDKAAADADTIDAVRALLAS